jgi:hypothetical protein
VLPARRLARTTPLCITGETYQSAGEHNSTLHDQGSYVVHGKGRENKKPHARKTQTQNNPDTNRKKTQCH